MAGPVDILLADGSTARVRQMQPDDADAIVALHSRLSERTRYLRYFAAYPRIPPRDLKRFVTVDHHEREAFVVELGGAIIAVGRYDRLGPKAPDAEVAFVVQDAHQGRGLGSVLIEHLAAAAREEGIERFVAEVLPINATMLRVFSDAGYPVEHAYADGIIALSFPIAATAQSLAVQRSREHRAEAASLTRLLNPRAVAVYGARSDGTGVGARLLRHCRAGFTAAVYPVHPSASTLDGVPAYRRADEVGVPVDLAIVAVPADAVAAVVRDCAAAGVRGVVVVSSGFADAGPAGIVDQAELVRLVRGFGMRLIGPNCLGIANTDPAVGLNATLAPTLPGPGPIGVFSQSAALGTALLAEADRRGLGLSTFVSAGNRADVSGNDLLQYWRGDPRTRAVLLYLETFGNPRKFARIARELARDKPVVAVASAVRRSAPAPAAGPAPGPAAGPAPGPAAGPAPAPAAGPDSGGVAALFASSGVIRVDTVAEMVDVGLLLADQPLPAGRRIAVVTNAAALGVLVAGTAPAAGLEVAAGYPRDVGPTAGVAAFTEASRAALADPGVDAILAAYVPALAEGWEAVASVAAALDAVVAGAAKPVAAVFPTLAVRAGVAAVRAGGAADAGGAAEAGAVRVGEARLPVPTYPGVEEAVRALGRIAAYAAWRREPVGQTRALPHVDTARARRVVAELAAAGPGRAGDGAVEELLACYGIPLVANRRCAGPAAAVVAMAEAVGLPVALKLAGTSWRHRIDLGAVRLGLASAAEVARAYAHLCAIVGRDVEVLIQPMVPAGVACVVEAVDDPAFGPIVGFGLGGVASELLGDRAWRPAPLTDRDAAALLAAPRAAPLLSGYAGSAAVHRDALADLLRRVATMADDHPRLRRLVLNPVLARPDGLSVLHATVEIGAEAVRPDTGPRHLT